MSSMSSLTFEKHPLSRLPDYQGIMWRGEISFSTCPAGPVWWWLWCKSFEVWSKKENPREVIKHQSDPSPTHVDDDAQLLMSFLGRHAQTVAVQRCRRRSICHCLPFLGRRSRRAQDTLGRQRVTTDYCRQSITKLVMTDIDEARGTKRHKPPDDSKVITNKGIPERWRIN